MLVMFVFLFSSRTRHTSSALVTGVQTCALPIFPRLPLSGDPAIDGDRIIEGADAVALERGDALHQRHTIGQIAAFGSETAGVRRQLGEHAVAARGGGMAGPVEAERRARAGVPDEARRRLGERRAAERGDRKRGGAGKSG